MNSQETGIIHQKYVGDTLPSIILSQSYVQTQLQEDSGLVTLFWQY